MVIKEEILRVVKTKQGQGGNLGRRSEKIEEGGAMVNRVSAEIGSSSSSLIVSYETTAQRY